MYRRFAFFVFLFALLSTSLLAQRVYISRVAPGQPANQLDILHRIELFNESSQFQDLSGYLVLTRYFAIRIPSGTFLSPYSRLTLGRNYQDEDLDIVFSQLEEWVVRAVELPEEGDFFALLTPELEWIDGFYYSPVARINFLPTEQSINTIEGEQIQLSLPDETDGRWAYLRNRQDPAMAMVQINGQWRPNSRTRNLMPPTEYKDLSAKFVDGIVSIKWRTLFERDCYFHVLERSTDGENYRPIERESGPINTDEGHEYLIYDTQVEKERVYYYRVSLTDKFGNQVESSAVRLRTEEPSRDFTFDIIQAENSSQRSFDVRFSSKKPQTVRVKLMDEQLREVSVLFYGEVEGERQNLINYQDELRAGKYYLVVATEGRRYYETILVE